MCKIVKKTNLLKNSLKTLIYIFGNYFNNFYKFKKDIKSYCFFNSNLLALRYMFFLKKHTNTLCTLTDLTAIECFSKKKKKMLMFLVYTFFSYQNLAYSFIYIELQKNKTNQWINERYQALSITNLFLSSNWLERECWDLFGIYFKNHKDLRIILTDYQQLLQFPLKKEEKNIILNTNIHF